MRRSSPLKQYNGDMLDVLEAKETPARHRSRKDTKNWCKGKIGREHLPEWIVKYWRHTFTRGRSITWGKRRELTCMVCGKVIKIVWSQFTDENN